MTTLKAAVVPAKVLKNGKHRIRIAIGHKQETRYIVTRFEIDNTANFKGGQVVGVPDAAHVNAKLRGILNSYQDALDKINTSSYTCIQLVEYLSSRLSELDEDSQRRLKSNPLRVLDTKNADTQAVLVDAPKLVDYLDEESRVHFEGLKARLDAAGIPSFR